MTPLPSDIGPTLNFKWEGGQLTVQSLGAMIADLALSLPDGRTHRPLARAPWVDEHGHGQTGLMAGLSGDWACVPFGAAGQSVSAEWQGPRAWEDPLPHGSASHLHWTLTHDGEGLCAKIELPAPHPIARLTRHLRPCPDGIEISLHILPRRDCDLPIGLHPVFALPDRAGAVHLDVREIEAVWTHPEDPSPDPSPVLPAQRCRNLNSIPTAEGTLDLSRLPLNGHSETRLFAVARGGEVCLTDTEAGVRNKLHYDADLFPAVMLWISNRGRARAPWSSRHLALGVEPVRACFDLGAGASSAQTPLRQSGVPTTYGFRAGTAMVTRYKITSELL